MLTATRVSTRPRSAANTLALACLVVWVLAGAAACAGQIAVPGDYATIQAAIDAAFTADEVVVAAGTHKENIDFKGKAITVRSTNPTDPAVVQATIIDGDKLGSVVTFKSGETAAAALRGLTITNGSGTDNGAGAMYGGGVYCDASSPTLANNIISANSAAGGYGGGVCCQNNCSPTLTGNTVSANSAGYGGGVACTRGSAMLTGNTVSGNSAITGGGIVLGWCPGATLVSNTVSGNSAQSGGGVCCWNGTYALTGNTISSNSANGGGGLYCDYSSSTLTSNTISDNTAHGLGGGVFCGAHDSSDLTSNLISGNRTTTGVGDYANGLNCDGGGAWLSAVGVFSNNTIRDNSSTGHGGGVWLHSAEAFAGNTISGNSAVSGGGLLVWTSSATLSGNIIRDNPATTAGGGVNCLGSPSPTLTGNTISGNSAPDGGGVYSDNSSPVLTDNTISGNSAARGGGVYCYGAGSSPSLTGNIIRDNTAADDAGGGVYCYHSSPTLTANTISGNSANCGGGVLSITKASLTLNANTISGNSAPYWGGGVYCADASVTLTNNIISGNSAYDGGGVYCGIASASALTNNTISGNSAGGQGGGVLCRDPASPPQIRNTIVALNTAGGGLFCATAGSQAVITYCDFYGNAGGDFVGAADPTGTNGNISADPLFVSAGDLHLKSEEGHWTPGGWVCDAVTSPCVNAGAPGSVYANEPVPNGGRINLGFEGNTAQASKQANHFPTIPTATTVTPASPRTDNDLFAASSGSTVADGDPLSYNYEWAQSTDGGTTWGPWGEAGAKLPKARTAKGEQWKARGRGWDGKADGEWLESHAVTIANTPPVAPTTVTVASAGGNPDTYTLLAEASGSTDADSDTVTYEYQWAGRSGGGAWSEWGHAGATLAHADLVTAEQWKARARASDGTGTSTWVESSPLSTQAGTLYVDAAVTASGDGSSWSTALKTITEAIQKALPDSTIIVAPGTYPERLNFGGKTLTVQSTDPTSPTVSAATIIDGGAGGSVVSFTSGESADTVLSGFTVTHGKGASGGGIVCANGAAPQITFNRIQANQATVDGGGVSVQGASPTLADNTISGNQAAGNGGGMSLAGAGTADVARNTIRNNTAANGGGVVCDGAAPQLSENTIRSNTATQGGGVCCLNAATPLLDANTVTGNSADYGGGIYSELSSPSITGNAISSNSADGGGGLYLHNCSPAVTGNSIADNSADDGAGVYCQGCASTMGDNIVVGNQAAHYGGGVYLSGGSAATLEGNTLDANRATTKGGGVGIDNSPATLHNTIITNSTAGGGVYLIAGAAPTITYCNVYNNLPADYLGMAAPTSAAKGASSGNVRADPGYADLARRDYHLRSQSGRWDPSAGTWVIDTAHSACIDQGDPATPYGREPQPNGGRVNMGAYGNTPEASKGAGLMAAHTPASSATGCARAGAVLITFRWPVVEASAEEHLQLSAAGESLAGACDWLVPFTRLRFTPAQVLGKNTRYTLSLAKGIRRRDRSLVNWAESFSFTTGGEPVVTSWGPKGTGVSARSRIVAAFDTPMHKASTQGAFRIVPTVAGTFSWSGRQLAFSHSTPLAAGTTYKVSIGAKARSAAGKGLGKAFTWTFTTAPASTPAALSAVALRTAAGAQFTVTLSAAAAVTVSVRNLAGVEVARLEPGWLEAGSQLLSWNGQSRTGTTVPAGAYLVQVQARDPRGTSLSQLLSLRLR